MKSLNMQLNRSLDQSVNSVTLLTVSEKRVKSPKYTMMMRACVLTGHGGYEKLEYRNNVEKPKIGKKDVLLRVLACGVNNTDVNMRIGWYSKSVETSTSKTTSTKVVEDGGWNSSVTFPFIQGTDCCGRVVEIGSDVSDDHIKIGDRVLVSFFFVKRKKKNFNTQTHTHTHTQTNNNNRYDHVRVRFGWDRTTMVHLQNSFVFHIQSVFP